jgi:hypothetical protein
VNEQWLRTKGPILVTVLWLLNSYLWGAWLCHGGSPIDIVQCILGLLIATGLTTAVIWLRVKNARHRGGDARGEGLSAKRIAPFVERSPRLFIVIAVIGGAVGLSISTLIVFTYAGDVRVRATVLAAQLPILVLYALLMRRVFRAHRRPPGAIPGTHK